MIANILGVNWFEVEDMPFTRYMEARDQAVNIGVWRSGGELQLQTQDDMQAEAEAEYLALLRRLGKEVPSKKTSKKESEKR